MSTTPASAPTRENATLAAAKAPVGTGASPLVAQLLALCLVALGVLGVQDVLARTGAISQGAWIDATVRSVDGVSSDSPGVLVGGVAVALVGLLLLPIAFRRRPRRTVELRASTGVRLRRQDLSRLVEETLEGADGLTDVEVRTTRRAVKVRATTAAGTGRHDGLRRDLEERLAPTLDALENTPRHRIRIKEAS